MDSGKVNSFIGSFLFGIFSSYVLMLLTPLGSTDPSSFGFYWAITLGMVSSFSTAWVVKKFQKKPEE